ncbi:uncharacterized protein LOC131248753 isoform X2 [Magnolia sinica]|uniref:uncharacterized protein LOC131248753 isoform X2 n=1 Tax=Magnolia sinica TaxID=86752 RepID=UPI002657FA62|nr:uncharacterized protein LOC131248753 isoform X2 [Magnolia sinica]
MGSSAGQRSQNPERNLREECGRVVELAKELQDSASSLISQTWNEEQSLRQRALALDSSIQRLQSSIVSAIKRGSIDQRDAEKLDDELYKARCIISDGDVSLLLPSKSHGSFLKMFLGPINVRATRKDVRLKVKEEYNSCKDRTAFLFLLLPSTLLLLRSWIWNGCFPVLPVQLYQRGVQLFLGWAMMQGVAMLLQNRYQRQRLYTRIALGKARRMDVVWGETSGVEGQLWLLCPILFILQGFEAYIGLLLLKIAFVDVVVSEWQVIVCGILLLVMAVGNFVNTVQTLITKSRFKAKMKRSKSRYEFDQGPPNSNLSLGNPS